MVSKNASPVAWFEGGSERKLSHSSGCLKRDSDRGKGRDCREPKKNELAEGIDWENQEELCEISPTPNKYLNRIEKMLHKPPGENGAGFLSLLLTNASI